MKPAFYFYKLKLFLILVWSLLKFSLAFYPLAYALVLLLTISLLGSLEFINYKISSKNQVVNSNKNVLEFKNKLELGLEKQPLHKDLLYNLSQVEAVLNNVEQAQDFKNRAKNLTPNWEVFN